MCAVHSESSAQHLQQGGQECRIFRSDLRNNDLHEGDDVFAFKPHSAQPCYSQPILQDSIERTIVEFTRHE